MKVFMFLTKVLRQFDFSEVIIDKIRRLICNNWYSVLVNGQSNGFFKSSRGVKQGDSLSPTFFILAAEVLSKRWNTLQNDPSLKKVRFT